MKTALITGVTGQDGSYLAELLLEKGYRVHGIKRRASSFNTQRIDHLYQDQHEQNVNFTLHYGDLTDSTNIIRIIQEVQPDEIYNLGAMSHVKVSFDSPEYVANVDGIGTLRILEAVRILGLEKKTRIYQASTSELYGGLPENKNAAGFYDENSPFYPRSPYGAAKIYGFWITKNYREAYGMFACNGLARGLAEQTEVADLAGASPLKLFLEARVRHDEIAVIEHVVADQGLDELEDLTRERRVFCLELAQGLFEAVRDTHVPSAELPGQLPLMVARDAQRMPVRHHPHHELEDGRDLRPPVDEITKEDGAPTCGRDRARKVRRAGELVSQLLEQRGELVEAAVHVTDDVERS